MLLRGSLGAHNVTVDREHNPPPHGQSSLPLDITAGGRRRTKYKVKHIVGSPTAAR